MKTLSIIKYTSASIGSAMLVFAFISYLHVQSFLTSAIETEGTVINLIGSSSVHSSSSSDSILNRSSDTYAPVVQFKTKEGKSITFKSSVSSNPHSYSIGESIKVLYRESDPNNAIVNSFFALWGGILIVGGLGIPFIMIGFGLIAVGMLNNSNKKKLMERGVQIKTKFHDFSCIRFHSCRK